jgi:hypothetical protein
MDHNLVGAHPNSPFSGFHQSNSTELARIYFARVLILARLLKQNRCNSLDVAFQIIFACIHLDTIGTTMMLVFLQDQNFERLEKHNQDHEYNSPPY